MISKKDNLASLIFDLSSCEELTLSELQDAAKNPKFPRFEVRTVGPKGSLQIKVPNQEWINPLEWALNHQNTIENKMKEDLERLVKTFHYQPNLNELGYYTVSDLSTDLREKVEALTEGLRVSEDAMQKLEDNLHEYLHKAY